MPVLSASGPITAWGRFETLPACRHRFLLVLAQITPTDLNVPILGQLTPTELPLGDALKPGPLEIARLNAPLRGGPLGE